MMLPNIRNIIRKSTAIIACAAIVSALYACGNSAGKHADTDMRIAMITSSGDITDQSFNQSTYEACKSFGEANNISFTYYKPEEESDAERIAMIDKAVADGFNTVVLTGYTFVEPIVECSQAYPDVKFIGIDIAKQDLISASGDDSFSPENVVAVAYKEEQAGYMAGYAAVKMGYRNLGFLGGMAVPSVIRFGYGFVQGANDAAKETGSVVTLKYVYGNQFYGDADITAAMDTWCADDTEVVFACGGGIYTSAAEACAKYNRKIIGVDVDQAPSIDSQYGENLTITSAMKGLSATILTILSADLEGNWAEYGGKNLVLGIIDDKDPTKNYVQLPMESTQWTDTFTKDDYIKLVSDINDGTITVSDDISLPEPSADYITVKYYGNVK